jgi:DNA-cytosine methyltransferase
MKILSLFDGMACGALAMQAAGIEVEKYIAYEVDKYAVQTAQHNFPFIEECGDVFKADFTEYGGFDYLIGGSPCTYWSIAQTKNRETVASGMGWELFSQYVRALHEAKPRFFLYENNKSMSAAIRASITKTFGFEPILINSALVSAQNRQRLYWCGIRQADGTYIKADIQQPADRGILLKDIFETKDGKAETLLAAESINAMKYELKSVENKAVGVVGVLDMAGQEQIKRVYGTNGKCATLTTCQGGHRELKVFEKITGPVCIAQHGRYDENGKVYQHYAENKKVREATNAPFYEVKDGFITVKGNQYPIKLADGLYIIRKFYEVKDGFITVKGNQYPIKLADGLYIIRKLTVRECMRLQTVPEWYEWPVSKSQSYKMLCNGWTVEVIAHLLRGLK